MSFLPVSSHPSVHVVRDSVLVGGQTLSFQDRSVRGLDDAVYEKHPSVWEAVPRGDCLVSIGDTVVRHIVGLRKFGYEEAPYGRRSAVKTVIRIDKENGECAHISAFQHAGDQWWVAGSKHVHLAWRSGHYAEDIAAYVADRYKYALRIAAVWESMLASGKYDAAWFFTLIDGLGATACAEAILAESEHIVRYDDGEKDTLKFFAIAEPRGSSPSLCSTPEMAYTLFRRCLLPTAACSAKPVFLGSAEDVAERETVARRINSEGVVCYGLDELGLPVCMWKEKSYPYVMERVNREAALHGRTLPQIIRRTHQRLAEMDPATRTYFAEWEAERFPWLLAFAAWLHNTGVLPAKDGWSVQCRWLTLQDAFRTAPAAEVSAAAAAAAAAATGAPAVKVIVLVGLPGSGKSTLARSLYKMLRDASHTPCWLNQDEADSNRQRYLGAVKRAMADPSVTHLILDKSNLDPANRKDYADLGLLTDLTVILEHPDGLELTKAVCAERFLARGEAHRSLRSAGDGAVGPEKFLSICDAMMSRARTIEEENILKLDVRAPAAHNLGLIWTALSYGAGVGMAPMCEDAVRFSTEYERAVPAFKRPMFGGLAITDAAPLLAAVGATAGAEALDGKSVRGSFHITLYFLGDVMDPVWFLDFAGRIGSSVELVATEIVWNDKGVCARVELPAGVGCSHASPHITLALAPSIKPVYSNDLLGRKDAKRFSCRVPLTGKFFFG
jgi:hypothetical protein